ncbi:MAG: glycosyltransferase [Gemmatimonadales bacterium]|nr:MAG: glycosyltransferase [Gemmatimonadales bacterium]
MIWILPALLPWIAVGVYMAFFIREPRPLPPAPDASAPDAAGPDAAGPDAAGPAHAPDVPPPADTLVSIIVPARNEARVIERCVASLTRLEGAGQGIRHEIIVVDDGSTDDTAARVEALDPGTAMSLRLLPGEPLPDGWFGKPWACMQGARAARGDLLLFTDADTVHEPTLLIRALAGLREDDLDALSLLGHQEMGTFAERLVQPQVFALIGVRFRGLDQPVDRSRRRHAIANGQFILVRREAYDAIDGHGAVRGEVVEDLRLAQEIVDRGYRLAVRLGEDVFSTRMYTSLGELVDGWTKNVATGARQAAGPLAPVALPGLLLFLVGIWLLPPATLLLGLAAGWGGAVLAWAGTATLFCVLIQVGVYGRLGSHWWMGMIYPAGTAVVALILVRSWIRGDRRIEWKGRRYSGSQAT